MTAAHIPEPTASDAPKVPRASPEKNLEIRQRLQDQQVSQLKSSQKVTALSPEETMRLLRSPEVGYATSWEYKFKAAFVEAFPELKDSVEKYQTNPGCGCRRQLMTAISLRHLRVTGLLAQVYGARIYEVKDIKRAAPPKGSMNTHPSVVASLAGHTVLIDPTPEAYAEYMKQMRKLGVRQYNGISVVPVKDAHGADRWALLIW